MKQLYHFLLPCPPLKPSHKRLLAFFQILIVSLSQLGIIWKGSLSEVLSKLGHPVGISGRVFSVYIYCSGKTHPECGLYHFQD